MHQIISEEQKPARKFTDRNEAVRIAQEITNTPRKGKASAQFIGAWNAWIVQIHPRANPYGNPAVLREDGSHARYN